MFFLRRYRLRHDMEVEVSEQPPLETWAGKWSSELGTVHHPHVARVMCSSDPREVK